MGHIQTSVKCVQNLVREISTLDASLHWLNILISPQTLGGMGTDRNGRINTNLGMKCTWEYYAILFK